MQVLLPAGPLLAFPEFPITAECLMNPSGNGGNSLPCKLYTFVSQTLWDNFFFCFFFFFIKQIRSFPHKHLPWCLWCSAFLFARPAGFSGTQQD